MLLSLNKLSSLLHLKLAYKISIFNLLVFKVFIFFNLTFTTDKLPQDVAFLE